MNLYQKRNMRSDKRSRNIFLDRSPDSHWLIAGAVVGALILLALFVVVAK
jgi:hypothetical protein